MNFRSYLFHLFVTDFSNIELAQRNTSAGNVLVTLRQLSCSGELIIKTHTFHHSPLWEREFLLGDLNDLGQTKNLEEENNFVLAILNDFSSLHSKGRARGIPYI